MTYCVNFVGGIKGNRLKVNTTQVFPQRMCCVSYMGGMRDKRCVHVQRVGGKGDREDLRERPEKYINRGRFGSQRETSSDQQKGY